MSGGYDAVNGVYDALKKTSPGLPLFLFSLIMWASGEKPLWMEVFVWVSLVLSIVCMVLALICANREPQEAFQTTLPPILKLAVDRLVKPIFVIAYFVTFAAGLARSLDAIGPDDIRHYVGLALGLIWMVFPILFLLCRERKWWAGVVIAVFFALSGARFFWQDKL